MEESDFMMTSYVIDDGMFFPSSWVVSLVYDRWPSDEKSQFTGSDFGTYLMILEIFVELTKVAAWMFIQWTFLITLGE